MGMSRKRQLKVVLLRLARAAGLFALARRLTAGTVKIVGYHYVSLEDEETRFPALFVTPDTLRRRLDHLTRKFRIVSLDEAVSALEEKRSGRGRVALTFDDGLYNFLAGAVPVLEEYEATATVYVVTGHLLHGRPASQMLLEEALGRTTVEEIAEPIPDIEETSLATPAARGRFAAQARICLPVRV